MNIKRQLIMVEANEIPFRILDDYIEERPSSNLARLMAASKQLATVCEDQVELDPWISWSTLHRGVIDETHQIFHLGQSLDFADQHYPPIWRLLSAQGVKVGVMGSLHSSNVPDNVGDYAFYLPDFFANEAFAYPADVVPFQRFNLNMTRRSARNVETAVPLDSAADFLKFYPTHGMSGASLKMTAKALAAESLHPHLRCRRRSIQPLLALDVFTHLMKKTRPEFATLYTNHVAAAMHRFWAAAYPNDPGGTPMPTDWQHRYDGEIRYAMDCLDLMLGRLMKFANKYDYTLVVCSSMGQAASQGNETSGFITIVDLDRFMTELGLSRSEWTERYAMVPCVSVTIDPAKADYFEQRLRSISCNGHAMSLSKREIAPLSYDRVENSFHLFIYFEKFAGQPELQLAGARLPFASIGWGFREHQDNIDCSARHTPHGMMLVHDPAAQKPGPAGRPTISTLHIAPAMLDYFGITPPNYMQSPDNSILDMSASGVSVVVAAEGGGVEETVKRVVRS
ncbi:hypothetical protein A5724_20235 [Mycobacterium sp. ACS1612]|uniref:hypothetical protein n=1 Tax=Mycobacterium sp. ACS1612 TaxID=1834117 RepID=UPI0007FE9777|nr:hypothetical protein [Mycobacterium sp. ACS1612]OBF32965.1 hypothetical protein A5724_20235 [Mycobacterium sp. ACS1612]